MDIGNGGWCAQGTLYPLTCLLPLVTADQTWPVRGRRLPVLGDRCTQGRPDHCHCYTVESWAQSGGCVR